MYRYLRMPLLIIGLLFIAPGAHAQFDTGGPLNLTIRPTNPRPYDTVTVTPQSSSFSLAASNVTVSVNGTVVEKGSGAQSVPVTVGGPGERTVISVSAVSGGKSYSASATVRPADVALVTEPVTVTHPLYSGAALAAPQGSVRIIALADLRSSPSTRLPASDLVYMWRLGNQNLASASGIGKSILNAEAPVRYRDAQITVTVTSQDGSLVAENSTVIAPVDPVALIYPDDPLMGPDFNHALAPSFTMNGAEEAFRAVGYFFKTQPTYSWAVNGASASTDRDVTVRTTGTGAGSASLSLSATSDDRLQAATRAVSLQFGTKSTNIFGF